MDIQEPLLEIRGLHFENHWHLEDDGRTDCGGCYDDMADISVAAQSSGGLGRPTGSSSSTQALCFACQTSY